MKPLNDAKKPLSLTFAIPDHPWVDGNDGGAVRIAMTVGRAGETPGLLQQVTQESSDEHREARDVVLNRREGEVFADLTIGADVAGAKPLKSNENLCAEGVKPHGMGFVLSREEAKSLGYEADGKLAKVIREYRNGRDLTQKPRDVLIIDLHGLSIDEVRNDYPSVYQWILERVKPERDQNREPYRRQNWWLFGRKNTDLRNSMNDIDRYIATVKTSKHRLFQYLSTETLPDSKLIAIAIAESFELGVEVDPISWTT
ncbi:hypothetical protein HLB35_09385 [Halomonas sp. TBZ9]|uniref:Uncharacterized protein n=1 Tax=Vreelandella azerica TaxID=2732867 RepID=A0A7Y3XB17_9GAMM|nr:hypothetical protein [Halomonas azerica]NOG31919.1 hypothetical protein [Halomonas azerica]